MFANIFGNVLAQHGHSCYELSNHKEYWYDAERECVRRFGHLVQINDSQEEAFIQQLMMAIKPNHSVWIGLTNRHNKERFVWTTVWTTGDWTS